MKHPKALHITAIAATILTGSIALTHAAPPASPGEPNKTIQLSHLSSIPPTTPGATAAIIAHDPATQRLFVVAAVTAGKVDVFDISNPATPQKVGELLIDPDEEAPGIVNSVAVSNGLVAVAVQSIPKTNPGRVVFFDTNLEFLSEVSVGAQPDMVTFTPNGQYVLTANEGEPAAYPSTPTSDPEGSISIIDVSGGTATLSQENVRTADFTAFNAYTRAALFAADNIRVFGPGASVAQDLEPEYIAVSHDSKTAWVTLQENNALAIVDIRNATVTELRGLGTKDHNLADQGFDASDRDFAATGSAGKINIANWPVLGLYEPDAIASYKMGGQTYLVIANEGDIRSDWPGYSEEASIGSLALDPMAFPNAATLKLQNNLGRLKLTRANGDTDGDGDYDQLYSFGGRSFSIFTANGDFVWDSGDQFEQITAAAYPLNFNASNNTAAAFDGRSDDKGPEPEGVTVAKLYGREYAFIALERIGGVMVYDISNPASPYFVQYINTRFSSGDLGPEGVIVISEENSPNGKPLVVVGNEISGSTTIFEVDKLK